MTDQERQARIEALDHALCILVLRDDWTPEESVTLHDIRHHLEAAPAEPTLRLSEALAVVKEVRNRPRVGPGYVVHQACCAHIADSLTALAGGVK